jgi:small-conductance mechanosensitive channel
MQNIAQSFVAGIILLAERVIKPGDVLRVEDRLVRVERLGFRSTQVQTRDGEHLIMPNSVLVQSTVTNYTLKDNVSRSWIDVGVVYDSNMRVVFETLRQVARTFQPQAPDHPPSVVLAGFGTSSVDFSVGVWFQDPWNVRKLRSDLGDAVWWALKERGITIAFPQLDVHFDRHSAEGRGSVIALSAPDSLENRTGGDVFVARDGGAKRA